MSEEVQNDWSYIAPSSSNFDTTANHSSFLEGSPPSLLSPALRRRPGNSVQAVQTVTTSQVVHSTPKDIPEKVLKNQNPPTVKEAKSKYASGHKSTMLATYGRRCNDAQKLCQGKKSQLATKIFRPMARSGAEHIPTSATERSLEVTHRVLQQDRRASPVVEASPHPQPVKVSRKPLSTYHQSGTKAKMDVPKKEIPSASGPSSTSTASAGKVEGSKRGPANKTSTAKELSTKNSTTQSDKFGTQKQTQISEPKVVFSSEEEPGPLKEKKASATHINLAQPFKTKQKLKECVHVHPKDPSKLRKGLAVTVRPREPVGGKENIAAQELAQKAPRTSVPVPAALASRQNSKSAEKRKFNETVTLDDIIDFSETKKEDEIKYVIGNRAENIV